MMISRSSILKFSSLCFVSALALGCSSGAADSAEPEALGSASEALLSCATVAPWQSGVIYTGGNRVQNGRVIYECKPWPESGWCGQREPGAQFSAWEAAWTMIDSCCGPVINEFTGNYGNGGPNDDFVEISNTCDSNFSTSGLKLVYRSAAGVNDVLLYDLSSLTLPANGYVLLTGIQFSGDRTLSNGFFGSNMSATAAGLALRTTNVVYDAVGYGNMTNIYKEGTAAAHAPRGESLSRIPNRQDTQNNRTDFHSGTPTPGLPNL